MEITYSIDFQYKPRHCETPSPAESIMLLSGEETSIHLVPVVGDFVEIGRAPGSHDPLVAFRGVVVSRFFRYEHQTDNGIFCHVNIVVEETPQDFSKLVQE